MQVIDTFIKGAARLPAPAPEVSKLIRLVDDPEATVDEIVDIFRANPALSVRLLKLANSAFYGLRGQVSTVRRATILLGLKTLRSLAVTVWTHSLASQYRTPPIPDLLKRLFRHSAACAVAAEAIARRLGFEAMDDAFLAGLLHDLGKMGMICEAGNRYVGAVLHRPVSQRADHLRLERSEFKFDHTQLGQRMAQHWGFPLFIQEAAGGHHDAGETQEDASLETLIALSDAIANAHFENIGPENTIVIQALNLAISLGFGSDRAYSEFVAGIRDRFDDLLAMMH